MIILSILVEVCIWILGLYKVEVIEVHASPSEFCFRMAAKFLCSCLCLFDAIVVLHPTDVKVVNDFLT